MSADTFLRSLVIKVDPNATVVGIEEGPHTYHVSVAGTTASFPIVSCRAGTSRRPSTTVRRVSAWRVC
jgi:hypothetical protein